VENYYFFDSNTAINDRRMYSAADWSKVLSKFLESGIYSEGENLNVTADGLSMSVNVGTGVAFIDGRMYENDSTLALNVDAAEAILNRIDLVVLRLDLTEQNRFIKAFIKKGVPNANPVAPVIEESTFIKEIALAEILVTAAKSTIEQAQITDKRPTDLVDPFVDGSRITALENWRAAHQVERVCYTTRITRDVTIDGLFKLTLPFKAKSLTFISHVQDTLLISDGFWSQDSSSQVRYYQKVINAYRYETGYVMLFNDGNSIFRAKVQNVTDDGFDLVFEKAANASLTGTAQIIVTAYGH
jgi:hypothetical protein